MTSTTSQNLFALLGEQDEPVAPKFTQPVDKKTTSSKKTDKAPAKADPTRARPKKADPNGNNAAFKDKEAGRERNREVPVPESAKNRSHAPKQDRKVRNPHRDTEKRVRQGWGDDNKELADEEAGAAIAAAEKANDAAEAETAVPDNTLTLEQYLAAQDEASVSLRTPRAPRAPNAGADSAALEGAVRVKKEEDSSAGLRKKPLRTKGSGRKDEVVQVDEQLLRPLNELRTDRPTRGRGGSGPRADRPARTEGERPERAPRGEGERRGGSRGSPRGNASRGASRGGAGSRGGAREGGARFNDAKAPNLANLPKLS